MTIEMEFARVRQQFMSDYQNLREYFLEKAQARISPSVLDTLKVTYSGVINSARNSDYIVSLEGLLRMLEKRGALSYDNIEPLKHISSTYVEDPALERALRDYEARIGRRSPLPRCNVYEILGGKYSTEGPRFRNCVEFNGNAPTCSNSYETTNDDDFNYCNDVSRVRGENESSPEDSFIVESEAFLPYHPPTVPNRRGVAKVRKKMFSKFVIGVAGALLGVGLVILFITISNSLYVKSLASAPSLEERPGVSGVQTIFNESRPSGIQAEMTLYTTQPAFRLTLPGSILLGPTNSRSSAESDSEDARMVLLRISEELGRSWRDVARHLGVRERDIDEIDDKHNVMLKEKAFQALQIFHNKCDPLQWKRKLKRALDEARRRDLMEMVDELVERSRSN